MTGHREAGGFNTFNLSVEESKTADEVADTVVPEMKLDGAKRSYIAGSRGWVGDNPVVHLEMRRKSSSKSRSPQTRKLPGPR